MAVRATGLKNFKGDNYVTEPMLTSAIAEATGGESGLIDKKTGNLRHDLNPIHITSIDNPTNFCKSEILIIFIASFPNEYHLIFIPECANFQAKSLDKFRHIYSKTYFKIYQHLALHIFS